MSATPVLSQQQLPEGKNYFRMREVVALLGVEAHVLRAWEAEFSVVRPDKSRGGQRVYRRKDVEALARIRNLLQDGKLSIKDVKEKLQSDRRGQPNPATQQTLFSEPKKKGPTEAEQRATLLELRRELRNIITICRRPLFDSGL